MPYKIDIIPFLDELEPEAESIGAVNCIYKKNNNLVGANTDGAGALWSLQQAMGADLRGKSVLVIGLGGAGLAVASYIAFALGEKGRLFLANRSPDPKNQLMKKLSGKCALESIGHWPITNKDLNKVDILINCSSVGFETLKEDNEGVYSLKYYTPLGIMDDTIRVEKIEAGEANYIQKAGDVISQNYLQALQALGMSRKPFVFDIIYQPRQTLLLSLARLCQCQTLNGEPMNLEQAVIAFTKATKFAGLFKGENDRVREIMRNNR